MRIQFLLILVFFTLFSSVYGQTLDSISPNSFFKGECYRTVKVYGSNLHYSSLTKKVYGVYLKHQITNSIIAVNDTTLYPNSPISAHNDSISIYAETYVPVFADTGIYDLIVISIGSFNPPGDYSYDTLFSAVRITLADGNFKGKIFTDYNLNKLFDGGDSTNSSFMMYYDNLHAYNIQYDTSCNFYIPSSNGTHTISIVAIPKYVLYTDSLSYTGTLSNSDISNLDFGLTEGFYSMLPDTVHQNDTVTFDLLTWGLFNNNFNLVEVRDSNNVLVDGMYGTTIIDTNHIQEHEVVSFLPGYYWVTLVTVGYEEYRLNHGLVVLPSIVGIDELNNDSQWIEKLCNPIRGDLVLTQRQRGLKEKLRANIYDVTGKLVLEDKISATKDILSTSILKAGIYFLYLIKNTGEYQSFKIVLE